MISRTIISAFDLSSCFSRRGCLLPLTPTSWPKKQNKLLFQTLFIRRLDCLSATYFLLPDFQPSTTKTENPLLVFCVCCQHHTPSKHTLTSPLSRVRSERRRLPDQIKTKMIWHFCGHSRRRQSNGPSTSVHPHTLSRSRTPVHTSL